MSINEERRSSSDEPAARQEGLQSLEMDLDAVSGPLQSKIELLETTTSDLASLLTDAGIAVIVLDVHLCILQFTPPIGDLMDLIPSDVGRPLKDLLTKFHDPALFGDCAEVLDRLVRRETEICSESGRHYMRRIHPYRVTDNRIAGIVITFIDMTSRKQVEESLSSSEERLRLLIEGARDFAMILLDTDGRIATWNVGAERLLGYSDTEAIGKSGEILLPGNASARASAWAAELATARQHGKASEDKWLVRKDGKELWGSGILYAVHGPQGEATGFVKVMRDDSSRKPEDDLRDASINEANEARREAEWATGLRDKLLAALSHELRTPLSSILIWSQVLRHERVTDEQREQGLKAIELSAESQKQLLNELLDTWRIVSGTIQLQLEPTNLQELIRTTVETLRPNAEKGDVTIDFHLPERDIVAALDPGRIRQVFVSLLANAIKFNSRPGRILISLWTDHHGLSIEIEDTGRGISSEALPRILDSFVQHDDESTRQHGGLGLGLAIAKQLIKLHGGTINARSPGPRLGSTFSIVLPYSRATVLPPQSVDTEVWVPRSSLR